MGRRWSNRQLANALQAIILAVLLRYLRPYQLEWIRDDSKMKAAVMSRQIGKSEVLALEAVLLSLQERKEPEQTTVIISASDAQAKLMLRKCRRWADIFDTLSRRSLGLSIYRATQAQERLQFFNGVNLVAIPPNPRTAAGYTGDVCWDEAGRTPFDSEVFEAIGPIIDASDFKFRMTGTPWGDSGVFWETLVGESGSGAHGWSTHTVTIHDAIRMGLKRNVEEIRRRYDPMTFAQDYECAFVSDQTSAFGRELLMAALELDLPNVPPQASDVRRALGVDVGRTHDRTALATIAEWPEGYYQMERSRLLHQVEFDAQEETVSEELARYGIGLCGIDATGMGMHMAENLSKRHPGIVQGIKFTQDRKEAMVGTMRAMLESRRLKLIPDNDLLSDMLAIRKRLTGGGRVVYDTPRTARGHSDLAWALMLAMSQLTSDDAQDFGLGFVYDGPGPTLSQRASMRRGGISYGEDEDDGPILVGEQGLPTPADMGFGALSDDDLEDMTADELSAYLMTTGEL